MLTADQFSVGSLSGPKELTLMMPRTKYELVALIIPDGETLNAVLLKPGDNYYSYDCTHDTSRSGILIPGVGIEIDHTNVFDPNREYKPFGSLIRSQENLYIASSRDARATSHPKLIKILDGLPSFSEHESVGFLSWKIVLGKDINKVTLFDVNVPTPKF